MHSSPKQVNDHLGYKRYIIQQALRVAYDQTDDQTSISQVAHTSTQ